ncbi:MAG: CPBP family intramembrane metalloprotease [Planctomycetes bacterium]|nr:CPBP family intramembrane metalloprotease [Planctomycetota bacterium]
MVEPLPDAADSRARRRALLALLLLVPAPSFGVLAAMYWWPGRVGEVIFFAAKAWMLALPAIWFLAVERQRISLSPARRGGFVVAFGLGVAISVVILGAMKLWGESWIDPEFLREEATRNGIGTKTRYLAAVAFWIFINSVLEEYVYRWFIFRQCERLMPALPAVLVSALCFTVHHVFALLDQFDWRVTVLASVGVFIGGAIWSWLYLRYRSIWPGYLSHAIVDVAIFWIGWQIIFG